MPTWASRGRALCAGIMLTCSADSGARAHSWYPPLCCNEIDCRKATKVVHNPDGSILMEAGHISVIVPKGFDVMPSQDHDAHVCVYRDIMGRYRPRCVFLPAEV